ncbi:hypothetical protein [Flavobacterium humidisoli]|uniref:FAS1 domain-containing protein n=1 Tax=Flavobacterium humidisoli TaxID=2937442 RepID=A0ABY4LXS3_9FLAO|nr:hypothetical protein [Flavobacterium humidisoli]UPZ17877.1 hypothetical protein M0M44_11125 [Flavobacterium humidisoli]
MKKELLMGLFLALCYKANSQVGVGTVLPNASAQLDVVSSDKGVLIPRVALQSSKDNVTIKNGNQNSLLVFNTSNLSDVVPGYYYWYDNRWNRILVSSDAISLSGGNVFYNIGNINDPSNDFFSYVDSSGAVQVIDIASMVKANETVTTLVGDSKAVYTYTNEKGDKVKIDVPGDVANNFQEIINNSSVQNILDQYIVNNVEGNVSYDAAKNTFTYVDSSGAVQVIDIASMVKANETVTTLVGDSKAVIPTPMRRAIRLRSMCLGMLRIIFRKSSITAQCRIS